MELPAEGGYTADGGRSGDVSEGEGLSLSQASSFGERPRRDGTILVVFSSTFLFTFPSGF